MIVVTLTSMACSPHFVAVCFLLYILCRKLSVDLIVPVTVFSDSISHSSSPTLCEWYIYQTVKLYKFGTKTQQVRHCQTAARVGGGGVCNVYVCVRHKMPFKPSNNLPHFHLSHFLNFSQRLLGFCKITSIKLTCEKKSSDGNAFTMATLNRTQPKKKRDIESVDDVRVKQNISTWMSFILSITSSCSCIHSVLWRRKQKLFHVCRDRVIFEFSFIYLYGVRTIQKRLLNENCQHRWQCTRLSTIVPLSLSLPLPL